LMQNEGLVCESMGKCKERVNKKNNNNNPPDIRPYSSVKFVCMLSQLVILSDLFSY
jgi:hypothetical protein